MTVARPRAWPVLLAAAVGLAILLSLGVWQVKRLAWKEGLIASIETSLAAPAVPLAEALARPDPAYARVKLKGHFPSADYLLVISTANGGPAWSVLRPFALEGGGTVMLDTGKSLREEPPAPPAGTLETEALVRAHGGKGTFDADMPAAGKVFTWWNLPAMAARLGATEPRFTFSLLPGTAGTAGLIVEPPKADLRNNHLGYAITWFGLAAALVAVTGVFLRQRASKADA